MNKPVLDNISFFSILNEKEKENLISRMETVNLRLGQTIVNRGDKGDAFYIIRSGKARVLGNKPDGSEINLSLLSDGDHFGEDVLIYEGIYDYTVRAASNITLLKLARFDFLGLLRDFPELQKYFSDYISNDGLRKFLKRSTILSPLNSEELRSLLDNMSIKTFSVGEAIVKEGEEGDAFYIIRSGKAEVIKESENDKLLNRIQAGDFFGELALLTGDPRKATIKVTEEVAVFCLAKKDFDNLIAKHPKIKDAILVTASGYNTVSETYAEEVAAGSTAVLPETEVKWESMTEEPTTFSFRKRRFRLPVILQQSEMDCGAASLAMICSYYGINLNINRLRDLANVTRDGATLYSLAEAAETLGFLAKGLRTDFQRLAQVELPAIAHWEGIHYIVIYRVTKDHVLVADPGFGLKKYIKEEFQKGWTGNLLALTPTGRLLEVEQDSTTLRKFWPYFKPHTRSFLDILLASVAIQIFGLALPLFTQVVIDQVLVYKNVELFAVIMVGMILVTSFNLIFTALRQYMITYVSQKIDNVMISGFYRQVMGLPLKFFTQRRVGDIITRVNENEKIREMLTTKTVSAILDAMTVIVYMGLMFFYNLKLALASVLFIPLFILLTLVFTPLMKKVSRQVFQKEVDLQSHMVEAVGAISTIKALNAEKYVRWQLEDKLKEVSKARMKGGLLGIAASSFGSMLQTMSSFVILFYGASLVLKGELTVGQLMAFTVLSGHVINPILGIIGLWDEFQEVRIAIERLSDVLDAEPEERNPDKTIKLPPLKGHIKIENLTFRYEPEGRNALQNINLEIHAGQSVALVGRSGSGKSTLANLLLKLYTPKEGKITIDGYDLRQANVTSLRRQVGVVQQDNVLFSGTIRENIAYQYPDASFQEIVSAAMLAGAHDFISAIPQGYETIVGERGMSLSGGQRQRIAIARALLGKPRILILDEATSALDTESEKIIQQNMGMILQDRTTIIIAHRLSTVRNASLIVVLDQGVIVETGNHQQLMAAKGLYYYLNSQQLDQ